MIDYPCHNSCMYNKKYKIKLGDCREYLEILKEFEDGFEVRIYGNSFNSRARTDYVSKTLFYSCIRTGVLIPNL